MTERDRIGGDGQNNGSETEGPEPEAEQSELSDLSAVQADDALLDALGGADSQVADGLGDQELSALLLAWRRDVDSEAIPELVDTNSAVTTVRTAVVARTARGRGRRRMLVPVAAAAAVLAIGFTGTALAARDAEPGDTLWGLSTVLYADHARSVEAAASVRTDLDEAYLAIAQERFEDARRALGEAEQALHEVTSDELAQLRARHNELLAQLDRPEQPPAVPPVSSTENTSDSEESGTSTPSDTVSESSEDEEPPPELDETSSIPTTEPSVPSTEPSSPSTTTEDSTSDEESGSSRSGTSISGDTPTG